MAVQRCAARSTTVFGAGLDAFCRTVLGPVEVVADRSWPHRESLVLQLRDPRGEGWIVKQFRREENYCRETHAYREWVGALGDAAPRLVAADETSRSIILTYLPGRIELSRTDADSHYRAGAVTRLFHRTAPAKPGVGIAQRLAERVDRFLSAGPGFVGRADVAFLRSGLAQLHTLPDYDYVPVHMDNQPRNWLVDGEGTVRLIDFELAREDVWVRDLVRLWHWDWDRDPELRDAFCEGYGSRPTEAEQVLIDIFGAVSAATTVQWAREHDDPEFEMRGRKVLASIRSKGGALW